MKAAAGTEAWPVPPGDHANDENQALAGWERPSKPALAVALPSSPSVSGKRVPLAAVDNLPELMGNPFIQTPAGSGAAEGLGSRGDGQGAISRNWSLPRSVPGFWAATPGAEAGDVTARDPTAHGRGGSRSEEDQSLEDSGLISATLLQRLPGEASLAATVPVFLTSPLARNPSLGGLALDQAEEDGGMGHHEAMREGADGARGSLPWSVEPREARGAESDDDGVEGDGVEGAAGVSREGEEVGESPYGPRVRDARSLTPDLGAAARAVAGADGSPRDGTPQIGAAAAGTAGGELLAVTPAEAGGPVAADRQMPKPAGGAGAVATPPAAVTVSPLQQEMVLGQSPFWTPLYPASSTPAGGDGNPSLAAAPQSTPGSEQQTPQQFSNPLFAACLGSGSAANTPPSTAPSRADAPSDAFLEEVGMLKMEVSKLKQACEAKERTLLRTADQLLQLTPAASRRVSRTPPLSDVGADLAEALDAVRRELESAQHQCRAAEAERDRALGQASEALGAKREAEREAGRLREALEAAEGARERAEDDAAARVAALEARCAALEADTAARAQATASGAAVTGPEAASVRGSGDLVNEIRELEEALHAMAARALVSEAATQTERSREMGPSAQDESGEDEGEDERNSTGETPLARAVVRVTQLHGLNHSLMARLARESERAQEATEEAQRLRKEVDLLERRFAALSASAEQRSGAGDTAREGEGRGADAQHVLMAEMERQLEASCSQATELQTQIATATLQFQSLAAVLGASERPRGATVVDFEGIHAAAAALKAQVAELRAEARGSDAAAREARARLAATDDRHARAEARAGTLQREVDALQSELREAQRAVAGTGAARGGATEAHGGTALGTEAAGPEDRAVRLSLEDAKAGWNRERARWEAERTDLRARLAEAEKAAAVRAEAAVREAERRADLERRELLGRLARMELDRRELAAGMRPARARGASAAEAMGSRDRAVAGASAVVPLVAAGGATEAGPEGLARLQEDNAALRKRLAAAAKEFRAVGEEFARTEARAQAELAEARARVGALESEALELRRVAAAAVAEAERLKAWGDAAVAGAVEARAAAEALAEEAEREREEASQWAAQAQARCARAEAALAEAEASLTQCKAQLAEAQAKGRGDRGAEKLAALVKERDSLKRTVVALIARVGGAHLDGPGAGAGPAPVRAASVSSAPRAKRPRVRSANSTPAASPLRAPSTREGTPIRAPASRAVAGWGAGAGGGASTQARALMRALQERERQLERSESQSRENTAAVRAARQEAARQRAAAHELRASAAGLTAANEVLRKEVTDLEDKQKAAEAALARAEHRAAAAERDRQGLRSLLDRLTAEQAALAQEAGARAAEEGAARAEHEKTVRRLREAEEAAARRVEEARTAQAAAEAARDAAERALATARAEARSASEEARLGRDRAEVLQQRLAEARERAREADRQRARAERAAEREAEAQAEAESLRAALRAAEQEGEAADEARIRCRSLERALEDTRAEMAARLAEAADAIERLTARGRRDGDGTQWQGIAEGLAREKVTLRALAEGAVAACRAAEEGAMEYAAAVREILQHAHRAGLQLGMDLGLGQRSAQGPWPAEGDDPACSTTLRGWEGQGTGGEPSKHGAVDVGQWVPRDQYDRLLSLAQEHAVRHKKYKRRAMELERAAGRAGVGDGDVDASACLADSPAPAASPEAQ